MKNKLLTTLGFLFFPIVLLSQASSDTLTIGTFNIRIGVPSDTGYRSWNLRQAPVGNFINEYKLDILSIQEMLDIQQEQQLMSYVPDYNIYSKGRENDEGNQGERVGIIYNKLRFNILDSGYFFLSKNPKESIISWDAACTRMCIWLKIKDFVTKNIFFVFCTHFDHMGLKSREQSAALIIRKIKSIAGKNTVFCMGDFNAPITEKPTYDVLNKNLKNTKDFTLSPPKGHIGTFNDWDYSKTSFPEDVLIDYIFFNKGKVFSYEVVDKRYSSNAFLSDHFPVLIKYVF
ncbi:MAG: endonuclease/exonuclease/phosphatase family protein [Chitinophagaceae bacterium]